MSDNKILPCPFCGSDEVSLSDGYMGQTIGHFVECIKCGASSHMNPDKNETIKLWNTRNTEELL